MKCVILLAAFLAFTLAESEDVTTSISELVEESPKSVAEEESPLRPEGRALNGYKPFKYYTPSTSTTQWASRYWSTTTPAPTRRTTVFDIVTPKYYDEDRNAKVEQYENEINPDGSFKYSFRQSNGIQAAEEGQLVNYNGAEDPSIAVQGAFGWKSIEGVPISIEYTADKDGYHPRGDAIPTAPAIPPEILRALEYVAALTKQA